MSLSFKKTRMTLLLDILIMFSIIPIKSPQQNNIKTNGLSNSW